MGWHHKRLVIVCVLLALLTLTFWTGSRYPALNQKAAMGSDTVLSGLGFDTLVTVEPHAPVWLRVVYTTINWSYTNKQGMTFGVLVAALLMTLIPLLNMRRFQHRLANTIMGLAVGTPLGLCVNCAAPLAQGVYMAGGRVEIALAAMMSSPTLNVVVLTMLFTLFPLHLALIKIGFTLVFLLIGIPLLTRALPISAVIPSGERHADLPQPRHRRLAPPIEARKGDLDPTWLQALAWVGRQFSRHLWYIVKTAVPFMMLAGLLGSAVVVLLPFDSLAHLAPQAGRMLTLLTMGVVSIIGVFLPVPMAFDLIMTAVLLQAGLPVKYAAILLFTLGIFSIYPFFIIWRTMSRVGAVTVFVLLTGLGVAAGVSGHEANQWYQARQKQLLLNAFQHSAQVALLMPAKETMPADPADALISRLQQVAMIPEPVGNIEEITITRLPFQQPTTPSEGAFRRYLGPELGLETNPNHSLIRMLDPFVLIRGIAAGDVHQDGWSDLLVSSETELALYANQQGHRYVRQPIALPPLHHAYITSAALVDVNNDGWLDLFFAAYRAGNHVIYNQGGQFTLDNWRPLPNHPEAIATVAVAFGDVDRDGDLDIALGNLTGTPFVRNLRVGVETSYSPSSSHNALLLQDRDTWQVIPFDEISAETLSLLFTDMNGDGHVDLLVGNDLIPPDYVYLGAGDGTLRPVTRAEGLIPHSTLTTMTITSADINNDLVPEVYIGHIDPQGARHLSPKQLCREIGNEGLRHQCKQIRAARDTMVHSFATREASACLRLDTPYERQGCMGLHAFWTGTAWQRSQAACDTFPETWDIATFLCHHSFVDHPTPPPQVLETAIPQVKGTQGNVLLVRDASGRFVDQASAMGLAHTGWTWNAKFADLDHDEWQDLYVVNGNFSHPTRYHNYFFRNQQGRGFVDQAEAYGLASWLDMLAYTYTDMDHDGDLDIVAVPSVGPLMVYVNQMATGHAITFELRDHIGNRFGIGSKLIIHYGDGRHQMRDMQPGGGYQSHDAPIVHFGLGSFDKIDQVDVVWSTGERSQLKADFTAEARYIITRNTLRISEETISTHLTP